MKKLLYFVLSLVTLLLSTLPSFAENENSSTGRSVGELVFYIVIVVLFCLGLILISKWGRKIKERDEEFEKERAEFLKKQEEEEAKKQEEKQPDDSENEEPEDLPLEPDPEEDSENKIAEDEDVGESE